MKLWLKVNQPFSWGLGFKNPAKGFTGAIGAHFDYHPQNHYK
jgi:hypothetical protein